MASTYTEPNAAIEVSKTKNNTSDNVTSDMLAALHESESNTIVRGASAMISATDSSVSALLQLILRWKCWTVRRQQAGSAVDLDSGNV